MRTGGGRDEEGIEVSARPGQVEGRLLKLCMSERGGKVGKKMRDERRKAGSGQRGEGVERMEVRAG